MTPRARSLFFVSLFAFSTAITTGCGAAGAMSPPHASGSVATIADAPGEALVAGKIERRIVRDGRLAMELKDDKAVDQAMKNVRAIPQTMGGFIASENRTSITMRVPTEKLDEAMAQCGRFGKVTARDVSAHDVTAEYLDVETRVENLRKLEKRLRDLLAQTTNVTEILSVEKELTRVTQELEVLEGRKKLLASQSSLATLRVDLSTSVTPGPIGWVFYGAYTGVKWLFVWD
jgi:hypothetical protein